VTALSVLGMWYKIINNLILLLRAVRYWYSSVRFHLELLHSAETSCDIFFLTIYTTRVCVYHMHTVQIHKMKYF
jgi:hypothetical protein